jgi:hypothetical protein
MMLDAANNEGQNREIGSQSARNTMAMLIEEKEQEGQDVERLYKHS